MNELLENRPLVYADGTFQEQINTKYEIEVEIPRIFIAQRGKKENP